MKPGFDLAFVLVEGARYPAPQAIAAAGAKLGVEMRLSSFEGKGPMCFALSSGAEVMYMLMPAPHPDAPRMLGPLSPSPEEVARAKAHYVVTALRLDGEVEDRDLQMAALTAVLVDASPDAVGAMLGHGAAFQKARLFSELTALGVEEGMLPAEVVIDVTAASEPGDRMSFLTHGMVRYGREELYVTCPVRGRGALDFVLSTTRWLYLERAKHLPTGDTIGRTADEKIVIQRVPSPTGSGPNVIRLGLAR